MDAYAALLHNRIKHLVVSSRRRNIPTPLLGYCCARPRWVRMPTSTNRETSGTLSDSALRQLQRTLTSVMKGWNQSLSKGIACATLLLALGSCSSGGSDGGGVSPGTSTVAVTSGTSFTSGPVRITFSVTNFTIG